MDATDTTNITEPEWLFRICERMHHCIIKAELERRGLDKASQPFILFILKDSARPLSQKDLADKIGVSPPTVAVSVQRMERAGLLSKVTDPEDLRRNVIALTDKGLAMVDECHTAFQAIDSRMFAGFSAEDREKLRLYYVRMIQNLEDLGAQPPVGLKEKERT